MGRKSTVSRLPAEIKNCIDAMLSSGTLTLDELMTDLQERYPVEAQTGTLPSRSAVWRYGQKLDRRLSAIRASTEAARMIQAHAGDDKDARSEALLALVQTELFEALLDLQEASEEEVTAEDRVALMSKVAKNIATLARSSVDLKKFQSEVEEATHRRLIEEQRTKLEAMPNKGGLTLETKAAIREALGLV